MFIVHMIEEVRAHRSVWVIPIAKANAVVVWITSKVNDDTHQNETDEGDDLDAAEPELKFAENADSEKVDCED